MKVFQKLDNFLDFGWVQITRGKADKKSPARHPSFVTSSADGFPNARTLVMRRSDRKNNQIEFHTDTASSKMLALKENPVLEFIFGFQNSNYKFRWMLLLKSMLASLLFQNGEMFQITQGVLMEPFLALVPSLEAPLPMIMPQIRNVSPF